MMRLFTADLHLGHVNIIRYCHRPFATVEEMNTSLVANWAGAVGVDDEVWVLGDVAMGKITETLPLLTDLPGRKHLVPGNHDRCWPGHRRIRPQDVRMYEDVGFEVHPSVVEIRLGEHRVVLCHLPTAGDSQDTDRFAKQRPSLADGGWLLHGHVHDKWRVRDHQVNVGVDVWNFRPVEESVLAELIGKGLGHSGAASSGLPA